MASAGMMDPDEPDNEILAHEAGLAFSDFSPTERAMLLRTREVGIPLYEDTPESEGLSTAEDASQAAEATPSRLLSTEWCQCGHCAVLHNFEELECVCCREMGEPVLAAKPEGCITEHGDFYTLCLNIAVLRVAYFQLRAWGHQMSDDIHKRYRYTAYRQFVWWLWGRLGEENRLVLPSCAVAKIRRSFPTQTPTGFKYPDH